MDVARRPIDGAERRRPLELTRGFHLLSCSWHPQRDSNPCRHLESAVQVGRRGVVGQPDQDRPGGARSADGGPLCGVAPDTAADLARIWPDPAPTPPGSRSGRSWLAEAEQTGRAWCPIRSASGLFARTIEYEEPSRISAIGHLPRGRVRKLGRCVLFDLNVPGRHGRHVLADIKGDPDLRRIPRRGGDRFGRRRGRGAQL